MSKWSILILQTGICVYLEYADLTIYSQTFTYVYIYMYMSIYIYMITVVYAGILVHVRFFLLLVGAILLMHVGRFLESLQAP